MKTMRLLITVSLVISIGTTTLAENVATSTPATALLTTPPSSSSPQQNVCHMCECTGDKTKIIDCTDKNLETIPNATLWPTDVTMEARFDRNNLVHLKSLGSIPGLTRLSLTHCRITVIDDMAFKELTNLTFIDLSNNQLTTDALKPHIFQGHYANQAYQPMKAMRKLYLGYNSLHSLDQDLFEHLTYLTELSLRSNPLKILDHSTIVAISSLDYLKVLDLSYTGLTTLPDGSFHSLRFLVELRLEGNLFKEVPTAALADTHDLKVLYLDDNPIQILDNSSFRGLSALEHLSLSFLPNLTRVGESTFNGMSSLKDLVITENKRLGFIHPDAFKGQIGEDDQWSLQHLQLKHNQLSVLPRDLIKRWNALDELSLTNNPWVCDCENQWMLDELVHLLDNINSDPVTCAEPLHLRGMSMQDLAHQGHQLHCLDAFPHTPDRDGAILVGVLIGVLLAVPLTIAVVALWRRFGPNLTGRHPAGPADFSRAFYKRADAASTISYEQA